VSIINQASLTQANNAVTHELAHHGLWDSALEQITVWLEPFSLRCYGWQSYGSTGDISIPRVSLPRIGDKILRRPRIALRDVLRHEWAHALADTHRGLIRSQRFSCTFGGSHDRADAVADWNPHHHVSKYAATNPGEDFAEVFMLWLKHGGQIPLRYCDAEGIQERWQFVEELAGAVCAGKRRW